jgi:RNA-binding protein YlmH
MADRAEVQKFLNEQKVKNYFFEGGKENADRSILVFYPEKLTEEMARKNISNILEVIRIKLPKELKYEHREYLSGIMKLGLKREKFGDIIVNDSGADIVALKDVSEYLKNGLQDLTRFRKSKIEIVSIFELKNIETKFEEMSIIVSSLRLDNFVSELARCSRTRAEEIILEQRVFVNSIMVEKASKKINEGDIITIRGKGKFIFSELQRETRNDRLVLNIKKYI